MKKATIDIKTLSNKSTVPTFKNAKEVTLFTETPDFFIHLTTQDDKGMDEKTARNTTQVTIFFPDGNVFIGDIDSLKNKLFLDTNPDTIYMKWSIEDIIWRGKDRGFYIHASIARKVLQLLKLEHDVNIGINWDTIDVYTDQEDLGDIPEWNDNTIPEVITCIDDVAKFLFVLFEKYSVMYHSGNPFSDMINIETKVATFTPEKAEELELIHDECLKVCENNNWDIDELASMVEKLWRWRKLKG